MSLYEEVKNIALDELRARGYAPNGSDVHNIATRVGMLLEHEVQVAISSLPKVASSPIVNPSNPPTPLIQGDAKPPTP